MLTARKAKILANKVKDSYYYTVGGAMKHVEGQAKIGFTNAYVDTVGTSAEAIFKAFKNGKFRTFIGIKGSNQNIFNSFTKGRFPKLNPDELYTIEVEW